MKKPAAEKKKKGQTMDASFELFTRGLTLNEIAQKRGLAVSTIAGHLERCMDLGYEVDINRLVPGEKQKSIEEFILNYNVWNLTPIVDYFKGEVSYEEARFVRARVKMKAKINQDE